VFYGLRPVLLKPLPVTRWEVLNWTVQMSFNIFVLTQWGPKAMLYFVLGALLGTGVHPLSGHFLEHLEVVTGQETYSYYGLLNKLTYNVGYHNEHHDFPQIPGSRLPQLNKLIPEYNKMPHFNNWPKVLFDFVVNTNTSLFCRVKRHKV
jgi:sphingolipid delta-4 desaturase